MQTIPNPVRLPRTRVLVLCTGNSVRSQMVEAWFRALGADRVDACSAGIRAASQVHPQAIRVMAEVGVDISRAVPKSMERYLTDPFDYVITVCAPAAEACPVFPGQAVRLHWPLDDPADAAPDPDSQLVAFRRIREEAKSRVQAFLDSGNAPGLP